MEHMATVEAHDLTEKRQTSDGPTVIPYGPSVRQDCCSERMQAAEHVKAAARSEQWVGCGLSQAKECQGKLITVLVYALPKVRYRYWAAL